MQKNQSPLVALLTNHADDVYCFRKELIEAMIGAGYRILISCPYGEKFGLMRDMEYIYDNPAIDRRGTSPINDGKLFLHYLRLFRQHQPQVVLAYTAKPNVYGSFAAHLLHIPVINNITGFGSILQMSGMKKQIAMRLFRMAYRKSVCLMFQNQSNMELAKQLGMVNGEYHLLPGSGVNTERYPLQPYPEGGDGREGAPVVFNYIGRILHDKGVDDYIEVAKRIRRKYPKTEFHMIGFVEPTEQHYERELAALEREGIIFYHGEQNDVRPFIRRSHATIHPSMYGEGISNVLLESASSGRPLITTDNPGCRETVEDGVTGFVYPMGNVGALKNTIERFLNLRNKERQTMGARGNKRMRRSFSRQVVIDVYENQIKEILS